MKKCSNGHYYDNKKDKYCPFCGINVKIDPKNKNNFIKKKSFFRKKIKVQEEEAQSLTALFEDQGLLISQDTILPSGKGKVPNNKNVVGWVVDYTLAGPKDYKLYEGDNFISIEDKQINIVNSHPPHHYNVCIHYTCDEQQYLIKKHGGHLVVGNTTVENMVRVKGQLTIQIEKYKIEFVPLCGEGFQW